MRIQPILALGCLVFSGAALADCQVSLSNANVSYGQVKQEDVIKHSGQLTALNERNIQLNAVCDTPQKMAIFVNGSAVDKGFRFANNSLMTVEASNATLDGKSVRLGLTSSHKPFNVSDAQNDHVLLSSNQGLLPLEGATVATGQQFSVTLTLKPMISTQDTQVRDQTTLESRVLFTVETE